MNCPTCPRSVLAAPLALGHLFPCFSREICIVNSKCPSCPSKIDIELKPHKGGTLFSVLIQTARTARTVLTIHAGVGGGQVVKRRKQQPSY